jgi:hypothetical protein
MPQAGDFAETGVRFARLQASSLGLNEIAVVEIETVKPLYLDPYGTHRPAGSFILVDPVSNATAAAGMMRAWRREEGNGHKAVLAGTDFERSRLTQAERFARAGDYPVTVWLTARLELAYMLERMLFDRGCWVHLLADDVDAHLLPEVARMSAGPGLITIASSAAAADVEHARQSVGSEAFVACAPEELPVSDFQAAELICAKLERRGFIRSDSTGVAGEGI